MHRKITDLHAAYCRTTGFDPPLRMGRDRVWFDFDKAGVTSEGLLLVIGWIRKQIPRGNGYTIPSLRFSTLLQLDEFEEKLALARHEKKLPAGRPFDGDPQGSGGRRQTAHRNAGRRSHRHRLSESERFLRELRQRQASRGSISLTGGACSGPL